MVSRVSRTPALMTKTRCVTRWVSHTPTASPRVTATFSSGPMRAEAVRVRTACSATSCGGKGEFSAALDTYRRLHAADPAHPTAEWLVSVLRGGRVPPATPPGLRPVPFVRLTNFLTPAQQKWLSTEVLTGRARFVPAKVGKGNLRREPRTAWVADREMVWAVRRRFGLKLRSVLQHVTGAVANFPVTLSTRSPPSSTTRKISRTEGSP